MIIPEKIPALAVYKQALNSYNPDVYPAHKRITAQEWNALLLSIFAQGNRQEYYLDQIVNGHLTELIETVNQVIDSLEDHTEDTSNPHNVTKEQVGLANVKNEEQATKVKFDEHKYNKTNPHSVTKAQVGLGNVDNTSDIDKPISSAQAQALNHKVEYTDINGYVENVTYNSNTHIITIERRNMDPISIDLPIEQLIAGLLYDEDTNELILSLQDGTTQRVPLNELVVGLASEEWTNNKFATKTENANKVNISQGIENAGLVFAVGADGRQTLVQTVSAEIELY